MKALIAFGKATALVSSACLLGLYVYHRAGGDVSGLLPASKSAREVFRVGAVAPTGSSEPMLFPGSKSYVGATVIDGGLLQTSPAIPFDAGDPRLTTYGELPVSQPNKPTIFPGSKLDVIDLTPLFKVTGSAVLLPPSFQQQRAVAPSQPASSFQTQNAWSVQQGAGP